MSDLTPDEPPGLLAAALARTPARILTGRAGPGYRTATLLGLRADHAAARDAVLAAVDPERTLEAGFLAVSTRAASRQEYLLRPDLGRQLDDDARGIVREGCPAGADFQVVVGDGLSAAAVVAQVPRLLPLLLERAARAGWEVGRPFFVRNCRVGVLNDVGELLYPAVVVLLVGERPGLATAESLSAYMAYRPRPGDTDARRNLISNIHARGVPVEEAARRVVALAGRMRQLGASGVAVKEELPGPGVGLLEAEKS